MINTGGGGGNSFKNTHSFLKEAGDILWFSILGGETWGCIIVIISMLFPTGDAKHSYKTNKTNKHTHPHTCIRHVHIIAKRMLLSVSEWYEFKKALLALTQCYLHTCLNGIPPSTMLSHLAIGTDPWSINYSKHEGTSACISNVHLCFCACIGIWSEVDK